MIILILYTATYSPYITAFFIEPTSLFLYTFETMVDVFFTLDILVNFITPYKKLDNNYEYKHKKISKHYITGFLWIDVISCFPTQFFESTDFDIGLNMVNGKSRFHKIYKVLRIVRVLKIMKINRYIPMFYKLVDRLRINRILSRLLLTTVAAVFMVHLFACFFFLIARFNDFEEWTWVRNKGIMDRYHFAQYVYSCYWAF